MAPYRKGKGQEVFAVQAINSATSPTRFRKAGRPSSSMMTEHQFIFERSDPMNPVVTSTVAIDGGVPLLRRIGRKLGGRIAEPLLFTVLILALVWALSLAYLNHSFSGMISAAELDAVKSVQTAEKLTRRALSDVDRLIGAVRERYARSGDMQSSLTAHQDGRLSNGRVIEIGATDQRGILAARTNLTDPQEQADLSGRPYVRTHINGGSDRLFISAPVQDQGSGTWIIWFSRPYRDRQGAFEGVILVALDAASLDLADTERTPGEQTVLITAEN